MIEVGEIEEDQWPLIIQLEEDERVIGVKAVAENHYLSDVKLKIARVI